MSSLSLFQWDAHYPYHLSVGALLVNEKGEICVHHFKREDEEERYQVGIGDAQEYYLLMRETLENNETIETAVARGLMEEFGATGVLKGFLGSIQSTFTIDGVSVAKTTVYFHVLLTDIDIERRNKDDGESKSVIEWIPPETLIQRMEKQRRHMDRDDRDESGIVRRYVSLT